MLSLLDIFCNGMGACVLLFLILGATEDIQSAGATPTNTVTFFLAHTDPTDILSMRIETGKGPDLPTEFLALGVREEGDGAETADDPCVRVGRNAPRRDHPAIQGRVVSFDYHCGDDEFNAPPPWKGPRRRVERVITVTVPPGTPVRLALARTQHGDDGASTWTTNGTGTFWKLEQGGTWMVFDLPARVGEFSKPMCLVNAGGRVTTCSN